MKCRDQQRGRIRRGADPPRARTNETVELFGGVVALFRAIDVIRVLYEAVEGQAGIMFMIVIIRIPVKRGTGPLV